MLLRIVISLICLQHLSIFVNSAPSSRSYVENCMDRDTPSVNTLGNITQTEFDHFAHVIPPPASKLTVLATTSHSVYIKWNIGIFENFKKGLTYKVSYAWYLAIDWNDKENKFNSEDAIKSQMPCRNLTIEPCWNTSYYTTEDVDIHGDTVAVNVTNLKHANVVYEFRIEMKSATTGDDLWSDPASLYAKTNPCPPYRSPETDLGGFEITAQYFDRRDVKLYWKDIPLEQQNGPQFQFEITMFEDEVEVKSMNRVTNSFVSFSNLELTKSYLFWVTSINYFGSAPYSTELRVPRTDDILPEVMLLHKVSFEDGIYELSWPPQDSISNKINNFTIFWCQSIREYPAPCSGPLNWIHVTFNITRRNVTLEGNIGYQFAISVNSLNSTSGMVWARCTILPNKLQKMRHVWVSSVGSNFIALNWRLECNECAENIKGYSITYCPVDNINPDQCIQPEETLLVYGDTKPGHAEITGLQPFTHYKMAVSIFTDKLLGPPSHNMCNRTLEAAPNMTDVKIQILNITNSSATITWNAPTILNGLFKRYVVFYNNEQLITNKTSVTLMKLTSYKSYKVQIQACTAYCSQSNPEHFRTSVGVPGKVSQVWIECKMKFLYPKLMWYPPEIPAGPNPIYDIRIQNYENFTISEMETTATEAIIKISSHLELFNSSNIYYVRAKNVYYSNLTGVKQYHGPWSMRNHLNCTNGESNIVWLSRYLCLFCCLCVLVASIIFIYLYIKVILEDKKYWDEFDIKLPDAFVPGKQIQTCNRNNCNDKEKPSMRENEIDLDEMKPWHLWNDNRDKIGHPNVDKDLDQKCIESIELKEFT